MSYCPIEGNRNHVWESPTVIVWNLGLPVSSLTGYTCSENTQYADNTWLCYIQMTKLFALLCTNTSKHFKNTGSPKEDQPVNRAENLSEDIREHMLFVSNLTQTPDQTPKDNEGPKDKNLTCSKCGRLCKIGEIQFHKKHFEKCQGGTRD